MLSCSIGYKIEITNQHLLKCYYVKTWKQHCIRILRVLIKTNYQRLRLLALGLEAHSHNDNVAVSLITPSICCSFSSSLLHNGPAAITGLKLWVFKWSRNLEILQVLSVFQNFLGIFYLWAHRGRPSNSHLQICFVNKYFPTLNCYDRIYNTFYSGSNINTPTQHNIDV